MRDSMQKKYGGNMAEGWKFSEILGGKNKLLLPVTTSLYPHEIYNLLPQPYGANHRSRPHHFHYRITDKFPSYQHQYAVTYNNRDIENKACSKFS